MTESPLKDTEILSAGKAEDPSVLVATPLINAAQRKVRTELLLRKSLEGSRSYVTPDLSPTATNYGGYVLDSTPTLFTDHSRLRRDAVAVHHDCLTASVGDNFIDQARFSDDNIFLEIVQNAQALDSKGTWFEVQFFAKGDWHPLSQIHKFKDRDIEGARIMDNGKGFLPTDAVILGGTKKGDPFSAGNFGTGMKISDRSALERGVKVVKYSGNWSAKLDFMDTVTSGGDEKVVAYNVSFYEDWQPGSTTEYWGVTSAMKKSLRSLHSRYLPLDPTFPDRIITETEDGSVLSLAQGSPVITVMGRSYELTVPTDQPFMFAYDLKDCVIDDQNRHNVDTARARNNVHWILWGNSNSQIFEKLMRANLRGEKYEELNLRGINSLDNSFWEALKEVYGVTDQQKEEGKLFILGRELASERELLLEHGYQKIDPGESKFIKETCKELSIPTGADLLKNISTTYTGEQLSSFEGENFASVACRAVMLINGLPIDQRSLQVVCVGGEVLTYDEFLSLRKPPSLPKYFVVKATGFKFEDPNQFQSLVGAAASAGLSVAIKNDNYEIAEVKKDYDTSRAKIYFWPWLQETDFEFRLVIDQESQVKQLQKLRDYSLNLDPEYQPYERTSQGDIVNLKGPAIYERGVLNSTSRRLDLILSYNFNDDLNKLKAEHVGQIIACSEDPEVPKVILRAAKSAPRKYFHEYATESSSNPTIWREAFKEVFGEGAALDDFSNLKDSTQTRARQVAECSEISVVNLRPELKDLLIRCGVSGAFEVVQGTDIQTHEPTPMQEVLCTLSGMVEEAVYQALPDGFTSGQLPIKIARSVKNARGDKLRSSNFHYINPVDPANPILYLYEELFQGENIEQLIMILVKEVLEIYRPVMRNERYASFRSKVLLNMEGVVNLDFYRKLREAIGSSSEQVSEVIKSARTALQKPQDPNAWVFPNLIGARIKNRERGKAPSRRTSKKRPRREPIEWPSLNLGDLRGVVRVGIALVALGAAGWGALESGLAGKAAQVIGEEGVPVSSLGLDSDTIRLLDRWGFLVTSRSGRQKGFERARPHGQESIGVSVERGSVDYGEFQSRKRNFFSSPALRHGQYMREYPNINYDGHTWEGATGSLPQFEAQGWEENERITHMQRLSKKQKVVHLRTISGGSIDVSSIKVLDEDKDSITDFQVVDLHNGDYEVRIDSKKATTVIYHTLSPINWRYSAQNLTNEDFTNLNPEVYEYYTETLNGVDLSQINFRHSRYRGIHNLQGLVDYLSGKPPFERIEELRRIIADMRYTITTRTEAAYAAFHAGKTSEKDFLSFVFNSELLENPGDGDCDVQNSIFVLLARECGIPARLITVVTEDGDVHAPSEVFLPDVGWVLMDTMGERSIIERETRGMTRLPDSTRRSSQITEQELEERLMKRLQYEELGCSELK